MKLVVAVSGATGIQYAVELIKALKAAQVEVHLVLSEWAEITMKLETDYDPDVIKQMADFHYHEKNMAAAVSSGSFRHQGMIVIPCSMKTLASIAHGTSVNLVARAADVTLKEGRKLLLVPRETPLNVIHLENMLTLARMGVRIMPPMPAFYYKPQTIDDLIRHFISRILHQFDIGHDSASAWKGVELFDES